MNNGLLNRLQSKAYQIDQWWHYAWMFSRHEPFVKSHVREALKKKEPHPKSQKSFGSRSIDSSSNVVFLDVGCGPRKICKSIVENLGHTYIGIDVYRDESHLHFNGVDLPFADCSTELIVSTEVLEHAEFSSQLLAEMARILTPGGQLIISIPFLYPIHGQPQDYRRMTTYGLKNDASSLGLRVTEQKTFGGLGSLLLFPVLYWRYFGVSQDAPRVLRLVSVLITPVMLVFTPFLNVLAFLVNKLDRSHLFYTQSVSRFTKE